MTERGGLIGLVVPNITEDIFEHGVSCNDSPEVT